MFSFLYTTNTTQIIQNEYLRLFGAFITSSLVLYNDRQYPNSLKKKAPWAEIIRMSNFEMIN